MRSLLARSAKSDPGGPTAILRLQLRTLTSQAAALRELYERQQWELRSEECQVDTAILQVEDMRFLDPLVQHRTIEGHRARVAALHAERRRLALTVQATARDLQTRMLQTVADLSYLLP